MPDLSITAAGRLGGVDVTSRLRQAAKQFEQQFAAQLLKPLTESTSDSDDLFGADSGGKVFKGLLVDGLAEHSAGGLGIANLVEREMSRRLNIGAPPSGGADGRLQPAEEDK